MDKHLHIISLDVPWPADYGGVIDIFYKIVSLHKLGVKIHLHCYTKGRAPQDELDKYCESVEYYPRKKWTAALSLTLPYIVASRNDEALLRNLSQDDYPVFMDGVHCTYLLQNGNLKNRKVFVRPHNVEFRYYNKLAGNEKNILKKIFFLKESALLKNYEKSIARKATFWPISEEDTLLYKQLFHADRIDPLPVFVPWQQLPGLPNKGCFCLYHGNLSVNENEMAATWLLKEVFNNLDIPLVVAGKNPSDKLEQLAHEHTNTCLVANPSNQEMQDLIRKAQVHVIPSFNNTGVKLKLLNALFNGRHCLVNDASLHGIALGEFCYSGRDAMAFKKLAVELYHLPFSADMQAARQSALCSVYDNEKNARQMINWIY